VSVSQQTKTLSKVNRDLESSQDPDSYLDFNLHSDQYSNLDPDSNPDSNLDLDSNAQHFLDNSSKTSPPVLLPSVL